MIRKLEIENFAGVEKVALALDDLTLVYGPNACGETSIRRALRYLLTGGRTEGTKFEDYIRGEAKSAIVRAELVFDNAVAETDTGDGAVVHCGAEIERRRSRSGETCKVNGEVVAKEQLDRLLRDTFGDLSVLDAVLEAAELPYMDQKQRQSILLRATDREIDGWPGIAAVLDRGLVDQVEYESLAAEKPIGNEDVKSIDDVEKFLVQRRRVLKRELAVAEAERDRLGREASTGPSPDELPRARTILRELESYRDKLLQRSGAEAADRGQIEGRLGEAMKELVEKKEFLRNVKKHDVAGAEESVAKMDMQLQDMYERRDAVRTEGLKLDAAAKVARERVEQAENWTDECPAFPGGRCAQRPFTEEEVDGYRAEAAEKHRAAMKASEEFQRLIDLVPALAEKRDALQTDVQTWRQEERELATARQREAELAEEITRLELRLKDASKSDDKDSTEEELQATKARIEKGQEFIRLAEARQSATAKVGEAETAAAAIADRLKTVDALAAKFGKDGSARLQVLRSATGDVGGAIASRVSGLLGDEYQLDSDALVERGEFELYRQGMRLHPAFWSRSERVRIGFAVQYALATYACSSLLAVFDEVDTLDREGRRAMADLLYEAMASFENVIALSTITETNFSLPTAGEGVAVYVLQGGRVAEERHVS